MKVSVVIPLYNKERWILRALESVRAQTFEDFEVVVVDDGSTDGGGDIVRGIEDRRVRLVVRENAGVSAARNTGVEESRSDLIAFLDADDEWLPEFLETVMDLRCRFPEAGACATAYRYRVANDADCEAAFGDVPNDPDGGLIDNYFRASLKHQPVCSSAVMVPRKVLKQMGGFPVGVSLGEDLDLWGRIALRYPIAWSPQCGAIYHKDSSNCATGQKHVGDFPFARTYEEFRDQNEIDEKQAAYIEEYIAQYRLYEYALDNWHAGNTRLAREMVGKSKHTRLYRRRWLYLKLLTSIPRPLAMGLLKVGSPSPKGGKGSNF